MLFSGSAGGAHGVIVCSGRASAGLWIAEPYSSFIGAVIPIGKPLLPCELRILYISRLSIWRVVFWAVFFMFMTSFPIPVSADLLSCRGV